MLERIDMPKLTAPFSKESIRQRPGRAGKRYNFVNVDDFIERMNDVFEGEWSLAVDRIEPIGNEMIAICTVSVIVGGTRIAKTQAAGKSIMKDKDGNAVSVADDMKSAISLAFKKCCNMFGVGLDVDDEDETPRYSHYTKQPTTNQEPEPDYEQRKSRMSEILTERTRLGLSREQIDEYCEDHIGKKVRDLTIPELNSLITALKAQSNQKGTSS